MHQASTLRILIRMECLLLQSYQLQATQTHFLLLTMNFFNLKELKSLEMQRPDFLRCLLLRLTD